MPRTVLIIEDDADTRSIYRSALEKQGYRVVTASQGAEGVHLARRTSPDLILLDIRMPVMDGWGAARYLKSDPDTRSIPICAISAYESDNEEGETSGRGDFDCFLTKPVSPDRIVQEVARRIGAALPPGADREGAPATVSTPG